MSDWSIRHFDQDDLKAVMSINQTCLPENYPDSFFMGLYQHAPRTFLVAEIDGNIVGYIMCRIERGVSSFGRLPVKKGHVVSIAVRPEYRHQGIGTALVTRGLEGMIEYGASEAFLEVRKTNTNAISVYERLGFTVKRVLRGYYRDGEDAYLMVKTLKAADGDDAHAL
ncbi:MAG: ribosomal protein S18-alanine N-acetyltransferase [Candidatus Thorarchaeota archaeon]